MLLLFGTFVLAAASCAARAHLPQNYGRLMEARAAALQAQDLTGSSLINALGVYSPPQSHYRFHNNKTSPFYVSSLPDVPYSLPEMYAGSLSINRADNKVNGTDSLWFIFAPCETEPVDELTIWLNGGPGWSSMEGFLQENGPFTWGRGTYGPVRNAFSWTNTTNVIWIDQPISTGFAVGTPTATDNVEVAQQFLGFLQNFEEVFGIKNFKIYLTGESYAGLYIPYIGAAMLGRNDPSHFNLSGAIMYDPNIGSLFPVSTYPQFAFPFIERNKVLFSYNDFYFEHLRALHDSCGFLQYLDQYLAYPPAGKQPAPSPNRSCVFTETAPLAEVDLNPCFTIYDIREICPTRFDPLGHSTVYTYSPPGFTPYFNRDDVKNAVHAPKKVTWVLDNGGGSTYAGGMDLSAPPINHVLPQIIEATNRVLIASGDFDMVVPTNATLLSIQNMTWNGQLGFQSKPSDSLVVPYVDLQYNQQFADGGFLGDPFTGASTPQGQVGIKHFERGLLWNEIYQASHSLPASQPRVAYLQLQWVLGRIDDL